MFPEVKDHVIKLLLQPEERPPAGRRKESSFKRTRWVRPSFISSLLWQQHDTFTCFCVHTPQQKLILENQSNWGMLCVWRWQKGRSLNVIFALSAEELFLGQFSSIQITQLRDNRGRKPQSSEQRRLNFHIQLHPISVIRSGEGSQNSLYVQGLTSCFQRALTRAEVTLTYRSCEAEIFADPCWDWSISIGAEKKKERVKSMCFISCSSKKTTFISLITEGSDFYETPVQAHCIFLLLLLTRSQWAQGKLSPRLYELSQTDTFFHL